MIIEILGGLGVFVIAVLSLLFKNERQTRKLVEKERDDAQAEALNANQRVESASALNEIHREKEKKDDEIIHSPVDRNHPLGMWDNQDSDGDR